MTMPHWKYRPYATVDLPDRTWPDRVIDRAPVDVARPRRAVIDDDRMLSDMHRAACLLAGSSR